MAYSTSNPPRLTAQSMGGGSGSRWVYVSSDSIVDTTEDDYFSNGSSLGMRLNDEVLLIDEVNAQIGRGLVTAVGANAVTVAAVDSTPARYTVDTTDATVTTLATLTPGSDRQVMYTAFIRAIRTGGSSGSANDAAGYFLVAAAQDTAGTTRIIGQSASLTAEDQTSWAAVFDATGATIRIRVTGASGNNVSWTALVQSF